MPRIPYDPNYLCFITTVTHQRQPLFRDVRLAERLGTMIHMACRLKGFVPLTYAILPDHVHLLVCSQQLVPRTLESVRGTSQDLFSDGLENISQLDMGALSSAPTAEIGALVQSLKGTFSRTLPRGKVWQRRYHCWMLSDPRDSARVIAYIIYNYRHSGVSEQFGKEPYVWRDELLIGKLLS